MNIADQAKAKLKKRKQEFSIISEARKLKLIADKFDVNKAKVDTIKQRQSVIIRRKLEDIKLAKELGVELEGLR